MFLMLLVSIVISKHLQSVPEFFASLVKESCFRSNRQHSVLVFPASKKNIITPSIAHFTTCNLNERKGRKDAPHKNSKYNFEREFRSECTSAVCYLAYPHYKAKSCSCVQLYTHFGQQCGCLFWYSNIYLSFLYILILFLLIDSLV